jgi:transcriptional regulator with XRE-family HTH domain
MFYICVLKIKQRMKLNRIKVVLVEKDLSQTWLAEKIGKSFSTVNAYCCNRQQPTLDVLNKIAEALSVSVSDLIIDKTKELSYGEN